MDTGFLLTGFILGFSIAAPVGPIGVLCIRRTLAEGMACGLASGLGAATADAAYGSIAGFGLVSVARFLVGHQAWLRFPGGAFLCYLGARAFLARPAPPAAPGTSSSRASRRRLTGAYASTLLLTLSNPLTIVSFAAAFSGLGLAAPGTARGSAALLVAGVFSGSALWWLALSGATSLLRSRLTARALRWVNRVSGLIILGFGLAVLLRPPGG
ncbi:MAG: LysE family translocator [Acetobacteraceae bacterium]|nr:LysE family translocator [Acetobacteraceae bacterium]